MSEWEETKRAGQTAFLNEGNSLQAAHESVNNFYSHILTRGYVTLALSNDNLTQQILDGNFREQKETDLEHGYNRVPEQDQGFEPER